MNAKLAAAAFAAIIAAIPFLASAQTMSYYDTGEEFAGPFPSWKSVKEFGAKGDGFTDDAAAINKALNAMANASESAWNTLYFPAGTHLIKSSLHNDGRDAGKDYTGTTIVGEDPSATVIRCGGPMDSQGSMLVFDGTYASISRFTFDGKGKAKVGLMRNGAYGTDTRVTDMVFRDMTGEGVQFGGQSGQGQDLSMIERCRFVNCTDYGLQATKTSWGCTRCIACLRIAARELKAEEVLSIPSETSSYGANTTISAAVSRTT